MRGVNLYEYTVEARKSLSFPSGGPCVFISHRKTDLEAAKAIARFLQYDVGVNIYFDEHDAALGAAAISGDDKKIVECLERGIEVSSHLLGLLSTATKDSWWVPFEIGSARRKRAHIGYILLNDVDNLPSYLKIARLVASERELKDWARELKNIVLWEQKAYEPPPSIPYLSRERNSSSVRFRNVS